MGSQKFDELFNAMSRFHQQLYDLVLREKPTVMVETGYANGLSAMHILAAMDLNECGTLYSVESFTNQDVFHPRLIFKRGLSRDVLPTIPGPWCCFLHDSDHGYVNQTFEFSIAWRNLKPGGVMIADDPEWCDETTGKPHHAWAGFIKDVDCSEIEKIGSAQWARKRMT